MVYYYKARVYDPVSGKFLQTDPVGDQSDLNLYAYVRDDPLNKGDPLGQRPWELYPSFENAAMDASNEAVLATRAAREHNEFGTRILKTPDGRYVYGPLIEGTPFNPNQETESSINLEKAAGSLPLFMQLGIFGAKDYASVHSHPGGNGPSSQDVISNQQNMEPGVVGERFNHAVVEVPRSAVSNTGIKAGTYSLSETPNQPGAVKSVTVNPNGSVTGHYEPSTGSRIGASLTLCPNPGNC